MIQTIPAPVLHVLHVLNAADHDAYLVGGCVRDSLLGRVPKDWDVTTDATPEQVLPLFPRVLPTGIRYGTVTVLAEGVPVEVTTFRADGTYSDGRRPDAVTFSHRVEDDLARRDFTINAMAYDPVATRLVDPFGGVADLRARVVRAVGDASARFEEDALRMLRAVRFATVLGFTITPDTFWAIRRRATTLANVSAERIRVELDKILLSDAPSQGVGTLHASGLLVHFLPEVADCAGFPQCNPHHKWDVFAHTCQVAQAIPPVLHLRLVALLHDVAKPQCFTRDADGIGHFLRHEDVGADMAHAILQRLKYDTATIDRVTALVREHMWAPDMGPKGARRRIARLGRDAIVDLCALRRADAAGAGWGGTAPEVDRVLAMLAAMEQEGIADPVAALAVNGHDVMQTLGIRPGPRVGQVLAALREAVVDDPALNERGRLLELAHSLEGG